MAILMVEQKKKYMDADGQICPFCGAADISGDSFECESAVVWQNVRCTECDED